MTQEHKHEWGSPQLKKPFEAENYWVVNQYCNDCGSKRGFPLGDLTKDDPAENYPGLRV